MNHKSQLALPQTIDQNCRMIGKTNQKNDANDTSNVRQPVPGMFFVPLCSVATLSRDHVLPYHVITVAAVNQSDSGSDLDRSHLIERARRTRTRIVVIFRLYRS